MKGVSRPETDEGRTKDVSWGREGVCCFFCPPLSFCLLHSSPGATSAFFPLPPFFFRDRSENEESRSRAKQEQLPNYRAS